MAFGDYVRLVARAWILIAFAAALGAFAAWASGPVLPQTYTSVATLYIASPVNSPTADAYQTNLAAQQQATSYAALAMSPQVAAEVADRVGSNLSPGELLHDTTAAIQPDSVVVTLSVRRPGAVEAQRYTEVLVGVITDEIARIDATDGEIQEAPAAVEINRATLPTAPDGMTDSRRSLLGGLVALALAVTILVARRLLDARAHDGATIRQAAGVPLLGIFPAVGRRKATSPLHHEAALERSAHEIATRVRLLSPSEQGGQIITVVAPADAQGSTTVVASLAAALAADGCTVLAVDADPRRGALTRALLGHVADLPEWALSDVLSGREVSECMVEVTDGEGRLHLVPPGTPSTRSSAAWIAPGAVEAIAELRRAADIVIVDLPALDAGSDALAASSIADATVVVARIGTARADDVVDAMRRLEEARATVVGIVATFDRSTRRHVYRR